MRRYLPNGLLGCTLSAAICSSALCQSPVAASSSSAPAPAASATSSGSTVVVPAGAKMLLALRSAVNTKTAQPGDGVYLSSTFPVISGNRVVIPAGVYVQGIIDKVIRPGRIRGRAQVQMHFTTLIFPNGSVVSIPGVVNSLPGSAGPKVKDGEGTVEQAGNVGRDVGHAAEAAAAGAQIGGIAGAVDGKPLRGLAYGGLAGAAGGLIYSLFTRGDDINLEQGQTIEMVLQRPLDLQESNLTGPNAAGLVPAPQQPQPLDKPNRHILCPPGGLGCS